MAKLWAKKERNKFYLPGEEIKVNRNFAFSGFDLEKDPLSACKNRMLLAVFGFILIYVIIAVRTLGICISGFSPDDGNGEKELPQLKIENPITRADVTDRNGTIIATSLPTANLFAHPRKVRDKEKVAAKLSEYIPDMLYEEILEQLEKTAISSTSSATSPLPSATRSMPWAFRDWVLKTWKKSLSAKEPFLPHSGQNQH